jgi:cold shock CspA family protein
VRWYQVAVGRILRFDDARGYGFIAPSGGGEDVFFHASDFGDERGLVYPGTRVEYDAEESERGLKVSTVRILDDAAVARRARSAAERPTRVAAGDDDELCDVLMPREFSTELTEVLIQHVPSLTGAQIAQIRQHVVGLARTHGWVES